MQQIRTNQPETDSVTPISYAYITRENGVRGGNAILVGTRIGVHDVISLLQNRLLEKSGEEGILNNIKYEHGP